VSLINKYGHIEDFPAASLGESRQQALLFKDLATLRSDAPLLKSVDALRWRGPKDSFPTIANEIGDARLAERAQKVAQGLSKAR
jgi:hypothetical protein